MRYKVYRSLDKPASFFGIHGRMIYIVLASLVVGFVLGLIMKPFFSGIGVLCATIGGAVVGYMVVQSVQERMSERQFFRMLASKRLPRNIRIRNSVRQYLDHDNEKTVI